MQCGWKSILEDSQTNHWLKNIKKKTLQDLFSLRKQHSLQVQEWYSLISYEKLLTTQSFFLFITNDFF